MNSGIRKYRAGFPAVAVMVVVIGLGLAISGCDEDDMERYLGQNTAASVERHYGVNRDPLISDWIDGVGQTMVSFSTRQQIPYTFKVLRTDIVNAFAGPWGHIYVTEGLLDFAETEDQVWCVVGHEIGHVEHRDIMKSLKQSMLWSVGVGIIGKKSQTVGDIAGIGLGLLSLRYSRKDEYEADDEGRRLSYLAGYDPHGEIQFFDRLQKEKERGSPCYIQVLLSTHPPTDRRISRQQQQPELNAKNVDALLHIGRGYMRRAHYAQAMKYFQNAVALAPSSAQAHTALADALAGRGEHQLATEQYQVALNCQRGDRYIAQRLDQAENAPPIILAALTPAERTQAQQELERAGLVALQASTAAIQAELFSQQLSSRINPVVHRTRQTTDELLGLAGEELELDDLSKDAVLEANAAIGKAADSVYAAEQIKSLINKIAPELSQAGAEARSCLERMAAGHGYAGQVAIVQRSLVELEAALSELQQAQQQALSSTGAIQQAQNSATDSLEIIQQIMKCDEDDKTKKTLLLARAGHTAARTDSQAQAALAAVRRAKKPAVKAQLRTVVARLNLSGLKAGAAQMAALDELVAYYTMGQADQVTSLREEGLGYGEAALALAAAKTTRLAPSRLAECVGPGCSLVDEVGKFSDSSYGAKVLLGFLAGAMEQEVEADS